MKHKLLLLCVLLLSVSVVAAQDDLPDQILAEYPGFFPEGIEYDAEGERFLLGSLTQGTIFAVDDEGEVTPFIEDEELVSSVGIHIDTATNRLLVANGDASVFTNPEAQGIAMLGAYDLVTGERQFMVDLGALLPEAGHFANDIAVDADGNMYVTDTFAGAIYIVDSEGNADVFMEGGMLADAFVNGIEYHPDGYLIVALGGVAMLVKIPLDEPDAAAPIELDLPVSGDGIIFHPDGSLIVVGSVFDEEGNAASVVVSFVSDTDWESATVTGGMELERQASTAAIRDEEVYIIFPGFEVMGVEMPETSEILRVEFEAMDE